jgi:hypothetical protein
MTNDFDELYEKYKNIPYQCKPISAWLEDIGDKMQHGMVLDESQQYRLSIAIRHSADTCKKCRCPEE